MNRSLQIEGKSQLWVFCDPLWKLYSVEHWKLGFEIAVEFHMPLHWQGQWACRWHNRNGNGNQSATIYSEGVVSGISQSSGSMRQSKFSEFPSRGFHSPSHSSPVLFSESIISEFQIPNFGIYDSKLRNPEWILGVQLSPWTSEPKYSASGSKLWEQKWHACFLLHAQQGKVGREACVWWIGSFLRALQDLNAAGTQYLFHKHCAYEAWHIGASNNKSKRPIQGTLQIQVTICALPSSEGMSCRFSFFLCSLPSFSFDVMTVDVTSWWLWSWMLLLLSRMGCCTLSDVAGILLRMSSREANITMDVGCSDVSEFGTWQGKLHTDCFS